MKQLLSAIHHCHSHNIMHRDLKPENIMFLSKKEKSLKIIDFGVGTSFKDNKKTNIKVGSVRHIITLDLLYGTISDQEKVQS